VLADWRRRIDRIVVVTAPDEAKVQRYVDRLGLALERRAQAEADARSRLAHQISDKVKAARADYVLENNADKEALRARVEEVWRQLAAESNKRIGCGFLE
jgi:dephospho-CoA kinase